jgi:7,8-dihydroneopterin aldolase/epimerase/oxygenase
MGIINVNGIKHYAYHGCMEEEAVIGGNYIVDVKIETDFEEAAVTDDLTKTVDYVQVNDIIKREMAIRSKLIEAVGKRIIDALMNEVPRIQSVEVILTKLNPPVKGGVEKVSVVLKRETKAT